jgi:hypothetical protein
LEEEEIIMATVAKEAYFPKTAQIEASSGVSWSAVWAGAFAAGALSIILMVLGAGIRLSALSPWPSGNTSASRIGFGAILWLILVQIAASALGGYLAGRLRTKWVDLHTHEVYFRDTAHGFLAWAVSLVISSLFFLSYAASLTTNQNRAPLDSAAIDANSYFVDSLFRTDNPASASANQAVRAEAATILSRALLQQDMPVQDRTYLERLVAANTGLNQPEAERRVSETLTADRVSADMARKTIAHSLYWLFVAFLIGAFCASFAATIGGARRDHVPV